jgi:hypothetical protein
MPMNANYTDALRNTGKTLITHIGLYDAGGTELAGGGYARLPVTWANDTGSAMRPSADLVFTTEAGDVVASWAGFSALTGGTAYGGAPVTQRTYSNPGTYTLLAASTSVAHQ